MSESASSITPVLLFTDIVNSTDLQRSLGDARYRTVWDRHNRLFLDACSQARNATVLKNTGDSFLVRFSAPSDGVACALRFQRAMKNVDWSDLLREPLSARAGLHLGEVEEVTDPATGRSDVLGYCASIAARVMSLATGGQVLMTRGVFDSARLNLPGRAAAYGFSDEEHQALRYKSWGRYLFKGAIEPDEICEIGIEGFSPLAPPPDSEKVKSIPIDYELRGWRPSEGAQIPHRDGWKLVRMLGEGGFGEAWLAQHLPTAELRVFKFCVVAERLQTFRREQALFRHLRQQITTWNGFARLFETHLDAPPYYLEVEYSSLGSLDKWAEGQSGIEATSLEERMRIFARVAFVADRAHKVDVIHCDLKPANILMFPDGPDGVEPRLTDFGIGHLAERSRPLDAANAMQTLHDDPASRTGTRLYTAPELHADPGRHPTVQRDIYALGVILFQLAVGDFRRPLGPGWESDISDDTLREDIAGAVDVHPERRFATAAELAERIANLSERRHSREAKRKLAEAEATALARRRRLVRRICALAVLTSFACAATWVWDYNRLKVSYYGSWIDRWSVPHGMLPLSPELRARRTSYKFTYQRRKLRRVQAIDATGFMEISWLRDDLPATQIEFIYRENGHLAERRYRDRLGKLLQTVQFSEDLRSSVLRREGNLPATVEAKMSAESVLTGVAALDADLNPVRGNTRIERFVSEFDNEGRLVASHSQTSNGQPAVARDGTWGTRFEYDQNNNLIKSTSLGPTGAISVDSHGVASTIMTYNARHRLLEKTFVGLDGKPVIAEEGYARSVYHDDESDRNILTEYFDPAGRPILVPAGFSSFRAAYDGSGNMVSFAFFDTNGKPVNQSEGHALRRMEHNARGQITRISYFDTVGAPCLNASGHAAFVFDRDTDGNPVNTRYFGLKGEPVASNGVFGIFRRFDKHGNTTFEQFQNSQGEPAVSKEGYVTMEQRFDARDRVIEVRYLDAAGKLTIPLGGYGAAMRRTRYDDDEHSVSEQIFDSDGQPTLGDFGAFETRVKLSEFGLAEEITSFDQTGKLILNSFGFSRATQHFDAAGRPVEVAWFGVNGEPVIQQREKTHRIRVTYDKFGLRTAVINFDTADDPAPDKSGYAETRYTYDDRGWPISEGYFDGRGHAATDMSGAAGYRYQFDERHNQISLTSVGADAQPVNGKEGYARMESTYNERNQVTCARLFDTTGQPTISWKGFHRVDVQYDLAGRETGRTYYGVKEERCFATFDLAQALGGEKNALGSTVAYLSAIRSDYDRFGRIVSMRAIGADDKPVPGFSGAHRIQIDYNEKGLTSGMRFFDDRGSATVPLVGFAAYETAYDERGLAIETRYLGADGRPMPYVDPKSGIACAIVQMVNDKHGRPVLFTFLDAGGKPFLTNVHAAGMSLKYDMRGNQIETVFLGLDGNPIDSSLGYAVMRGEYDDSGNVSRQSSYDATGHLIALAPKHSITTYKHNVAGQTTEMQYLDDRGQPGEDEFGVSRMESEFDIAGREVGRSFFDVANRPVVGRLGFAALRARYDGSGQMLSQQYFAPNHQLINVPAWGYAQEEYTYDQGRHLTEVRFLDALGKLVNSATGVARKTQSFTATGSEANCFDAAGNLTNSEEGWARRIQFNAVNGQPELESVTDSEGRSLLGALVIERCIPYGHAEALGLQPGDIVLRAGPWSVLEEGRYSFAWRILRFAISRVASKEPEAGLIYRKGALVKVTILPGPLGAKLNDRYVRQDQIAEMFAAPQAVP